MNRSALLELGLGVAMAASVAAGCAANGLLEPGRQRDTGPSADAAVTLDTGVFAPLDASPGFTDHDTGTGGREDTAAACADFVDDDHSGATDCEDIASCGTQAICCVGSTDARCCAPPVTLPSVIDLSGCASGVLATCAGGFSTFGAPLPTLASMRHDGGGCAAGTSIAPQGSDRSDGGLVASARFDTTAGALAIEARVGVSAGPDSALDAIAVGLTAQQDLAGTSLAHVRPVVAVLVSATDQTIRAIAGDVAFPAHALGPILAAGCSELEVRIVTSPAGTFDASYRLAPTDGWTALERARPYGAVIDAHVVVYGRSTNPGLDGVHAWVRSVSVGRSACDVLDPARTSTGAFTALPSTHPIHSVSRVGSLAVYEMDGSIYVAGVDGTGHLQTLGRSGSDGDRLLAPGEAPFMAHGLADPEIVAIDEYRRLFFTGIDADGVRSIGYLDFDTTLVQRVTGSMPRQLLAPDVVHVVGVDGPAYFEDTDAGTGTMHRFIVFRAIVDATHSELRAAELYGSSAVLGVALEAPDATASPTRFVTRASPLQADDAFYANRSLDETAFDHDEIASPEIVVYRGVVRVFFAARHGARWSIGMLRSPDFAHFELAYDRPVLTGSGVGFDAVSVSDPDVTVDATNVLSLYYTASDGTSSQPGVATQEVPP